MNYFKYITILCLLFFVGSLNGLMDALQFHDAWQNLGDPRFWNPNISWQNKWVIDTEGVLKVGVERFWGSSRWFVFVTDAWHLSKFFYLLLIKLTIIFAALSFRPQIEKFKKLDQAEKLTALVVVYMGLTLSMAAGFHLVYTIIF